jgi:hypothetical protein
MPRYKLRSAVVTAGLLAFPMTYAGTFLHLGSRDVAQIASSPVSNSL